MHMQSVRDLKAELLSEVQASHTTAHSARIRRVAASLSAAPQFRLTSPIALGIHGQGEDYKLAIRIQEVPPGLQQLLQHLQQRAHGEVDIRMVGYIQKQQKKPWHQKKQRPLLPGVSVGHVDITAGTLGCFVTPSAQTDQVMILSNNHVLANENNAKKGEVIIQPGQTDRGKQSRDTVGRLARFIRLKKRGNVVDAALATLETGIRYQHADLPGLGTIAGFRDEPLDTGAVVYKVGRTTGVTQGRVSAIEVDNISVEYDRGILDFDGQLEIEPLDGIPFSKGGDSGALIVDSQYRAIGLLFAGNDRDVTYANPLPVVFETLGIHLLP